MFNGRLATVTKRITHGSTGEVMVGTPEGFRTLFACTDTPEAEFLEGTTVLIVDSENGGVVTVKAAATSE